MATGSVIDRLEVLEREIQEIKHHLRNQTPTPWWERIAGTFSNSENYDEAMRLGKARRESLRQDAEGIKVNVHS